MKGTVTKKGNRWYPRVYIGKDENGKWKQKWGKGYETKKEAEKQLRVLLDEVRTPTTVRPIIRRLPFLCDIGWLRTVSLGLR